MILDILNWALGALMGGSIAGFLLGRLPARRFYCIGMWVTLSTGVQHVYKGDSMGSVVDAAFFAIYAWAWWRSGGGDDTKRRLRSLGRAFSPVRRTAPSPA